jgi:hypothetical protein
LAGISTFASSVTSVVTPSGAGHLDDDDCRSRLVESSISAG